MPEFQLTSIPWNWSICFHFYWADTFSFLRLILITAFIRVFICASHWLCASWRIRWDWQCRISTHHLDFDFIGFMWIWQSNKSIYQEKERDRVIYRESYRKRNGERERDREREQRKGNVAMNSVTRSNNKVVYDSRNNENGNSIQTISIYLENHQFSSCDIEMIDVVDTVECVCG